MANKSVDRDAMLRATQQLETKHQQIYALQSRLQGQMNDLKSRWHGNAANAFQRGYSSFDAEFEKVKNGLDKIHVQLVETLRQYGHQEAENLQTANQIDALINRG